MQKRATGRTRESDRLGGWRSRIRRATSIGIKEVLTRLYKMAPLAADDLITRRRRTMELGMQGRKSDKQIASDLWHSNLQMA